VAIYHCHVKAIGRSNGKSAVGAAAYRAGENITNERDGETHNYTQKTGVVHIEILLPDNAPEEYKDRATLWNEVERQEKSENALLARELDVALPKELTIADSIKLIKDYCTTFTAQGMCVDVAIHNPRKGNNPHAHIMVTARTLNDKGEWQAKTEKVYLCRNAEGVERGFTSAELQAEQSGTWSKQYKYKPIGGGRAEYLTTAQAEARGNLERANKYPKCEQYGRETCAVKPETIEAWRERWATLTNAALERASIAERVDHRSYARQGIDQEPTKHLGPVAAEMERRGIESDRGDINREITARNIARSARNEEIEQLRSEIVALEKQLEALPTEPVPVIEATPVSTEVRRETPSRAEIEARRAAEAQRERAIEEYIKGHAAPMGARASEPSVPPRSTPAPITPSKAPERSVERPQSVSPTVTSPPPPTPPVAAIESPIYGNMSLAKLRAEGKDILSYKVETKEEMDVLYKRIQYHMITYAVQQPATGTPPYTVYFYKADSATMDKAQNECQERLAKTAPPMEASIERKPIPEKQETFVEQQAREAREWKARRDAEQPPPEKKPRSKSRSGPEL
jgi:hypothetical protein